MERRVLPVITVAGERTDRGAAGRRARGASRHGRRDGLVGSAIVVLGSAIVAFPDSDDRVLSFSDAHGPARLDVVGLAVFAAGYLLLTRLVWRRRKEFSRRLLVGAVAVSVAGAGLLAPAIACDLGALWALAAGVMAAPQAYVLLRALVS